MNQPLQITLKTLTPLWTGGVGQTCDRLHETGLIGSLRWWYEALVRGLGGYACDPTSEKRCEYDPKKPDPPEKQLCAACYLFGCTGWARKFRLRVSNGQSLLPERNILIPSGRKHQTKKGERAGGWFVFNESRIGEIVLDLIPLRDANLEPICTILALISRHASLGPKGASGYGVIQAKDIVSDLAWLQRLDGQSPQRNQTLPDFRDFFFARFQFSEPKNREWWQTINGIRQAVNGQLEDGSSPSPLQQSKEKLEQLVNQGVLPLAPTIRNWLRYEWKHKLDSAATHFVFGEAQGVCPKCYQPGIKPDKKDPDKKKWCPNCRFIFDKDKEIPATASKLQVSYAYRINNQQWEFRIWGWIPCAGHPKERDAFLTQLQSALQGDSIWKFVFRQNNITPHMNEWHMLSCDQANGQAYLSDLLSGGNK
ncbi:MAG: type III-B CRISPR module RAMP protein Cmr1 [Anaerolineales bacterium]|nr:type III-B CRISPR module RAMP protein Cmr1 [Anaerolineales bacterium]MDW8278975.1 type III-B CRISPR module RAMP protein Cmr1 [Anaerolineales bacterium]